MMSDSSARDFNAPLGCFGQAQGRHVAGLPHILPRCAWPLSRYVVDISDSLDKHQAGSSAFTLTIAGHLS
jgi:hypothetical protein